MTVFPSTRERAERTFLRLVDFLLEMEQIVGAIAQIGELRFQNDDDFVDRLSRRYTTFFLVLFALIVSTKQYVGEPMACWVPAHFTSSHEEYTNRVCWVSNTYYLPFDKKTIPQPGDPKQMIGYYQWIPMILISQGILFFIPCIVWRFISRQSGLNITSLIEAAMACARTAVLGEPRDKTVRYIVNMLDTYLATMPSEKQDSWTRTKHALSKRISFFSGHCNGNFLIMSYLFIKTSYVTNAVGQLFLLNFFLGTDYHMFGFQVLTSLLRSESWQPTARFPRVTLCDFEVRTLGQTNRHTVQCVLPINLFNEKIYVFVWFWFVFVAFLTTFSMLTWAWQNLTVSSQTRYVKGHLKCMDRLTSREMSNRVDQFTRLYLHRDGVFVLRLVSKNAGDMISAEMCAMLWDTYRADQGISTSGGYSASNSILLDETRQALNACGVNSVQ